MRPPRSLPGPLPVWHATQPRAVKIGNTVCENDTLVGSGAGAPSDTLTSAIVTAAAPTGDVAISSVTVAVAAVPSDTTPAGTSKNTAQPLALDAVKLGAGIMFASRNFGPVAPVVFASTRFEPATPAFGVPAASTRRSSTTPFAADGVI